VETLHKLARGEIYCSPSTGRSGKHGTFAKLKEVNVATISDKALSILKDACGVHDFTDVEQARIEVLAAQLNEILNDSKERDKKKAAPKN